VNVERTKEALSAEWFARVFGDDAAAAAAPDPLGNPVAYVARVDLARLVDMLLAEAPIDGTTEVPDALIRLRAVQQISAAEAVSHVFVLKDIVRERFRADARFDELSRRLDFLALHTFNAYAMCREQLYDLRLRQISEYGPAETFACQAPPPPNGLMESASLVRQKAG
jgi:hypothetical protein